MSPKTLLAVVTTAAALTFGANARAEVLPAGYEAHAVTVQVADLNLDNDVGARRMLARVVFAADQVCGETGNRMDLRQRVNHRLCVSVTVERALAELDSPRVSQIYGRQPKIILAQYLGD